MYKGKVTKDRQHRKLNYYHQYDDVGINDNIERVEVWKDLYRYKDTCKLIKQQQLTKIIIYIYIYIYKK